MTARETTEAARGRATLSMRQPLRCREVGAPRHSAPEGPVVAAAEIEIRMRNARGRQCGREVTVLLLEGVVAARVEPEVRLVVAERRRYRREQVEGCVRRAPRERPTEDGVVVHRALVPRPALDERELLRRMQGHVDRPVAA